MVFGATVVFSELQPRHAVHQNNDLIDDVPLRKHVKKGCTFYSCKQAKMPCSKNEVAEWSKSENQNHSQCDISSLHLFHHHKQLRCKWAYGFLIRLIWCNSVAGHVRQSIAARASALSFYLLLLLRESDWGRRSSGSVISDFFFFFLTEDDLELAAGTRISWGSSKWRPTIVQRISRVEAAELPSSTSPVATSRAGVLGVINSGAAEPTVTSLCSWEWDQR